MTERDNVTDQQWLERERAAIESYRRQTEAAVDLFRRATEALPQLDARLREWEAEVIRLKSELDNVGREAATIVQQAGVEQAVALTSQTGELLNEVHAALEPFRGMIGSLTDSVRDIENSVEALRRELTEEISRREETAAGLYNGLEEVGRQAADRVEHVARDEMSALEARARVLIEEAQNASVSIAPLVESLQSRTEVAEASIQSLEDERVTLRGALGEATDRLEAQSRQIEELAARFNTQWELIQKLREDDAVIRGTVSFLNSQITWLNRFAQWFISGGVGQRLFGRGPS